MAEKEVQVDEATASEATATDIAKCSVCLEGHDPLSDAWQYECALCRGPRVCQPCYANDGHRTAWETEAVRIKCLNVRELNVVATLGASPDNAKSRIGRGLHWCCDPCSAFGRRDKVPFGKAYVCWSCVWERDLVVTQEPDPDCAKCTKYTLCDACPRLTVSFCKAAT